MQTTKTDFEFERQRRVMRKAELEERVFGVQKKLTAISDLETEAIHAAQDFAASMVRGGGINSDELFLKRKNVDRLIRQISIATL